MQKGSMNTLKRVPLSSTTSTIKDYKVSTASVAQNFSTKT